MQVCETTHHKATNAMLPLAVDLFLLVLVLICVCGLGLGLRKSQFMDEELIHDGHAFIEQIVSGVVRHDQNGYGAEHGHVAHGHAHSGLDAMFGALAGGGMDTLPVRRFPGSDESRGSLHWRLVSRSPLNPANAPCIFENQALISFEYGAPRAFIKERSDNSTYFHYMEPLYLQKRCLMCHSGQGYRQGDVYGGVSLRFNIDHVESAQHANCYLMAGFGAAMIIALLLLAGHLIYKIRFHRKLMTCGFRTC